MGDIARVITLLTKGLVAWGPKSFTVFIVRREQKSQSFFLLQIQFSDRSSVYFYPLTVNTTIVYIVNTTTVYIVNNFLTSVCNLK